MPLPLCGLLKLGPKMDIIRMSKVFHRLCKNVYNHSHFHLLELDVVGIMEILEMEFPPLFLNIMIHLLYHLVQQLDMYGPMASRWMYPIKKYMKTLKRYV